MKTDADPAAPEDVRLRDVALAAIAYTCMRGDEPASVAEDAILVRAAKMVATDGRSPAEALAAALESPHAENNDLIELAVRWRLCPAEVLVTALANAVEQDPLVGRVLAHVQSPVGGSRPTLGLIGHVLDSLFETPGVTLPNIVSGMAAQTGLLTFGNETAPMPERTIIVPTPLNLALCGRDGRWPGATIDLEPGDDLPLPASMRIAAERHADALAKSGPRTLVVRSGSRREGCAAAAAVARAMGLRPVFLTTDELTGIGGWLLLRGLLPVHCVDLGPGERRMIPAIAGYREAAIVVTGPDGAIEPAHGAATSWPLAVPTEDERDELWHAAVDSPELAARLARDYRHGAGRIHQLGRLANHHAALAKRERVERTDVLAAARSGEGSGLDSLAEPMRTAVPSGSLILPAVLQTEMAALVARCRARDGLVAGLGVSAQTRYEPGVRALFTGPSGTGKTLAAAWVATELGQPLYRVDLASITSKYIGETEKNLAMLLARAEQAEVILLFDEADSLFGKRTEIGDANDRFANAQTNYLLQRIESYSGIVLLTSNSQARFDAAFARRLDFVIEFQAPGPEERRRIWEAHLGSSTISSTDLNRLAARIDVTGGHIRNAVLAAAVRALHGKREISYEDLLAGVEVELRKLGRQLAVELKE